MINDKYLQLTLLVLTIIFGQSCHKACDESSLQIEEYLQSVKKSENDLERPQVYYFISMGGCQDCVMKSIEFSKNHANNPAIIFALVSQTGNKTIRVHYDKDILDNNNFFIDGKGVAYSSNLIGSNITIYYLSEGCYKRKDIASYEFDEIFEMVQEIVD